MFLDNLEFKVKNKTKNCRRKTVLKMGYQICEKMGYVSLKILLDKKGKN